MLELTCQRWVGHRPAAAEGAPAWSAGTPEAQSPATPKAETILPLPSRLATSETTGPVNSYQQARLDRIASNQATLAALELKQAVISLAESQPQKQ